MATDGRGGIHSSRKRAFAGQTSQDESRLDIPNTNVQVTPVEWASVGPIQYPEIHDTLHQGQDGGPSGGFVLGNDRPD